MTDQLHILVVPSWYSSSYNQGNGSFIREQAIALEKNGFKVGVIYNHRVYIRDVLNTKNLPNLKLVSYFENNISTKYYESLQLPSFGLNFIKKINDWLNLKKWKNLYKKYVIENGEPDLIHAHSFFAGNFLTYLANNLNKKYVITEHWSGVGKGTAFSRYENLIAEIYNSSKAVIGVSQYLKTVIEENAGVEVEYIPNGVDFDSLYVNRFSEAEVYSFIAVGYFRKEKRFDLAIESFALFLEKHKSKKFKLKLIGSGDQEDYLRELVGRLEINEFVAFLGFLPKKEVLEEISASNCLLSTSEFETFGVTLIEALSVGVPVVATDSFGPRSILIKPEFGILVREASKESISDSMAEIYNSKTLDRSVISTLAESEFSNEVVVASLTRVYERVLNARP